MRVVILIPIMNLMITMVLLMNKMNIMMTMMAIVKGGEWKHSVPHRGPRLNGTLLQRQDHHQNQDPYFFVFFFFLEKNNMLRMAKYGI